MEVNFDNNVSIPHLSNVYVQSMRGRVQCPNSASLQPLPAVQLNRVQLQNLNSALLLVPGPFLQFKRRSTKLSTSIATSTSCDECLGSSIPTTWYTLPSSQLKIQIPDSGRIHRVSPTSVMYDSLAFQASVEAELPPDHHRHRQDPRAEHNALNTGALFLVSWHSTLGTQVTSGFSCPGVRAQMKDGAARRTAGGLWEC